MLVLTLAMAAVGFALLVLALTTGSVAWAWGCIAVCVVGAVPRSELTRSRTAPGPERSNPRAAPAREDDPPTERFDRPG